MLKLLHLSALIAVTGLLLVLSPARADSRPACAKQNKLLSKTAHVVVDQSGELEQSMFPLVEPALNDYTQGIDAFGSPRNNGRTKSAGVNLETKDCGEVVSIAAGRVLNAPYRFYDLTYAVDIQLLDGTVVRYAYLAEAGLENLKKDDLILQGQTLAYVKKLRQSDRALLRVEIFSGEGDGALTQMSNEFRRRSDLVDPTLELIRMERRTFLNRD